MMYYFPYTYYVCKKCYAAHKSDAVKQKNNCIQLYNIKEHFSILFLFYHQSSHYTSLFLTLHKRYYEEPVLSIMQKKNVLMNNVLVKQSNWLDRKINYYLIY